MIIRDPQQLVPASALKTIELPDLILDIPSHGIPLHSNSIKRLLNVAQTGQRMVAFHPSLPVTSDLGLGRLYPTLAYLYPKELADDREQIIQAFARKIRGQSASSPTLTVISDVGLEEQLHYFSDYYGQAVQPTSVRVIVGNLCNLKCVMCPYHSPVIKPTHTTNFFQHPQMMDWAMMERLADDCGMARSGVMLGNVEEPLLHPRLVDFIQRCRHQGVPRIHLTTNGQLLDQQRAKLLLEAGLTSIDISLDAASSETYRQVRGASLERVEANIMTLLDWRDRLNSGCEIRVSFVRNQGLKTDEEEKFREKWLKKLDGICVLNLAQYEDANMQLSQGNCAVQQMVDQHVVRSQGRWACLFPFTEISILPNGKVYYCIETLFRLGFDQDIISLGDYHQQSLQDIWQGSLFQQLRRDLIQNRLGDRPMCQSCDTWKSQVVHHACQHDLNITTTLITEVYQLADLRPSIRR